MPDTAANRSGSDKLTQIPWVWACCAGLLAAGARGVRAVATGRGKLVVESVEERGQVSYG